MAKPPIRNRSRTASNWLAGGTSQVVSRGRSFSTFVGIRR